jgi:hypothetical protein
MDLTQDEMESLQQVLISRVKKLKDRLKRDPTAKEMMRRKITYPKILLAFGNTRSFRAAAGLKPVQKPDRGEILRSLYECGGVTMTELSDAFGQISRERVRQILRNSGCTLRNAHCAINISQVLYLIRKRRDITSWLRLQEALGKTGHVLITRIKYDLRALGHLEAVERLFRARRRLAKIARAQARKERTVEEYKRLCEEYGRVLTTKELIQRSPRLHHNIYVFFGDIEGIRIAAGVSTEDQRKYGYTRRAQST